jgi:glycerate 2-kinase
VRVVVAPDKFKGSLTAAEAAEAISAGLRRARPETDVVLAPIADGGDGTVDAAVAAGYERVPVTVMGPTGEPVTASFALSGPTAVVEMAEASGLRRLPGGWPAPLTATTYGTGELIRAALDRGAQRVVLGVGGSATTDGGTGMAQALGARFRDAAGRDLPPGGAALRDLVTISLDGLDPRLRDMSTKAEIVAPSAGEAQRSLRSSGATKVDIVVASDVDNPLIGDRGAASVYGPQKGADPADVERLEEGLTRLASVVAEQLGVDLATMPGAGAAGGTGGGAVAFLGARLVSGIELLLDLVRFPAAVAGADVVITGEGSLDRQSLAGKAPWGVAQAAGKAGVPVVALAGRSMLPADEAAAAGFAEVHALTDVEPDLERCQRDAVRLLALLAQRLAETSPTLGGAAEPRR